MSFSPTAADPKLATQQWQEQKAQLGKCQACGKLKAEGGCGGERQSETFNCWLAVEANELNV
ncbi:hypothetical protein QT352_29620 (plasmid) [Escherichia coli]|nr:hypothetical protein [Escherichia coli]